MLQIVMRLYCKEFKSCPTDLVKFPSSAFKKKNISMTSLDISILVFSHVNCILLNTVQL